MAEAIRSSRCEFHDLYLRAIAPVGLAKATMPAMQKVSRRAR